MSRVAVIPARGGSKRILRKNIRSFAGRPIIAWSIEAALVSGCFDRVVVSTDDEEIAAVARGHGAEVPFMRPPDLCGDHVATAPVIRHAIQCLTAEGTQPEFACCVYATAPFIDARDIRRGERMLIDSGADYAFAVTSYAYPIQRAIRITPGGRVQMLQPEQYGTRSQDLEPAYHDAGQFYWGRSAAWLSDTAIFSSAAVPIILQRHLVQDIDTMEDWRRAELMFACLQREGNENLERSSQP